MNYIYHHDLDPFILRLGENFGIRWYGLAYLLGFLLGYILLRWQHKKGWLRLGREQLLDLILFSAIWLIIGARVGYVLFYNFTAWLADPLYILYIWEGGMSFHGGLLGLIGSLWWYTRKHSFSFWSVADAGALAATPGLMFGRIANFINGGLWGRPTGGDWGVVFPLAGSLPRHPSQLYEATVQGPVLLGILLLVRRYCNRQALVSVAFMIAYGLLRFSVGFYRAPDPHLGYSWFGLTRGQIFSLTMVIVGAGFWGLGRLGLVGGFGGSYDEAN
ncbi:MAG: prolipoprotein diacylglyceryl transferase [bacterium]